MAKIFGYCPSPNNHIIQTDKAIRVTVRVVDDETANADTTWLPKSIARNLRIEEKNEDGIPSFELTADVPAWWVAKLDTRPAWQKQGYARPPMAQRPW